MQELLGVMGIESIHHVHFPIGEDWGVSPDFVFGTLFVWDGGRGDPYNGKILMGIEVKFSETGRSTSIKRYRLLALRLRVPILILTRSEVEKWYRYGRLPVKRATRAQYEKLVA